MFWGLCLGFLAYLQNKLCPSVHNCDVRQQLFHFGQIKSITCSCCSNKRQQYLYLIHVTYKDFCMSLTYTLLSLNLVKGGGPRVVVSTAAFHARVRGSVPGRGGFKETKMFLPHPRVKVSIVGSLRDREVACSASDRQGSNFESCV